MCYYQFQGKINSITVTAKNEAFVTFVGSNTFNMQNKKVNVAYKVDETSGILCDDTTLYVVPKTLSSKDQFLISLLMGNQDKKLLVEYDGDKIIQKVSIVQ